MRGWRFLSLALPPSRLDPFLFNARELEPVRRKWISFLSINSWTSLSKADCLLPAKRSLSSSAVFPLLQQFSPFSFWTFPWPIPLQNYFSVDMSPFYFSWKDGLELTLTESYLKSMYSQKFRNPRLTLMLDFPVGRSTFGNMWYGLPGPLGTGRVWSVAPY